MQNIDKWQPSKYSYRGSKILSSPTLDSSSRVMAGLIAENYQELLPKYANGRLLDLGCGAVPLYLAYKDLASEITCVDWGNTLHGVSYLDYEMDLNQPLKLESDAYDTIILSDVLEHIRKPEDLLVEINRILAKGGTLIMNVPFFYWLHEKPHDYYRYTQFALQSILADNGFSEIKIWSFGGLFETLMDIYLKNIYPIPVIGKPISWVLYKLFWGFIHTSPGKWLQKRTSKNFPYGYFAVAQKY